jgi:hypothetical protein
MGKVIELLDKIKEMKHAELLNRYKQIVRAQAVREYLGTKEDIDLTIEVNLSGEEIVRRMSQKL